MATENPVAQLEQTNKQKAPQTTGNIQQVQQPNQTANQTPAPAAVPVDAHRAKIEAMEMELKALELENAKLALEERKANTIDLKERLQERELNRENVRQEAYTKGSTIKALDNNRVKQQERCNHKKGGNGAQGVVGGLGDDSQYAVLKHKFAHGDVWVRCLRCAKTWKPPVKSQFINNQAGYDAAMDVYKQALNFQTRNVASGGIVFQYSDGGEFAREQMAATDLR